MSEIVIYQTPDRLSTVEVTFDGETVWLNQYQLSELFDTDRTSILKHLQNIYATNELSEESTCAKFAQVRQEGNRKVKRQVLHYNLDAILSVGYRVNSKRGTQFRQWATQKLKDYLVKGYIINEKRLAEKQQQVEYLKAGIRILNRALTQQAFVQESQILHTFAMGLTLLDDYDHQNLDQQGSTIQQTVYPTVQDYLMIISKMQTNFDSTIFAQPKDGSFESSVRQIQQTFNDIDLYPSLEEKAATLLYLIVKNHSFIDGNKRIGAACFLYFLEKNGKLDTETQNEYLSNQALAALTLFVASSRPEEMNIVKQFIISILNRK
jgi:death-on-curing family protein